MIAMFEKQVKSICSEWESSRRFLPCPCCLPSLLGGQLLRSRGAGGGSSVIDMSQRMCRLPVLRDGSPSTFSSEAYFSWSLTSEKRLFCSSGAHLKRVPSATAATIAQLQLRRVKSTVHLTGKPSLKTKQRMVDLLAPSKGEVIATTAIASHSRSSSYADLSVLGNRGAGGGGDSILSGGQAPSYRGELREGDEYGGGGEGERGTEERSADDGWDDSVFGGGGSALGGVSELGVPAGAAARRGALQKVTISASIVSTLIRRSSRGLFHWF